MAAVSAVSRHFFIDSIAKRIFDRTYLSVYQLQIHGFTTGNENDPRPALCLLNNGIVLVIEDVWMGMK